MYEELCDEELFRKAGGPFRLTTLIQKRMIALMQGAEPLVQLDTNDRMKIVIQEILQDKIYLDTDLNVQIAEPDADKPGSADMVFPGL